MAWEHEQAGYRRPISDAWDDPGLESQPRDEAMECLQFFGVAHLADQLMILPDERVMPVRAFMDICGQHVRPLLAALERYPRESQEYARLYGVLKSSVYDYLKSVQVDVDTLRPE